jgi:biopolymer transport protein ExbD
VMLVLLVMLIITIPIQLHSVNLDLPVGSPPPLVAPPPVVRVDIDAASVVYWQGLPLSGRAELEGRLSELAAQADPAELHIRPHRDSRYEVFAQVMVAARERGLNKLGVVGGEQFIGR